MKVTNIQAVDTLAAGDKSSILKNRKEPHFFRQLSVIGVTDKGATCEPVQARFYFNQKGNGMNPVYCCVWIHSPGLYTAGGGRAGGCGYDKQSAALQVALDAAGVSLDCNIAGTGECEEALLAVAEYLGIKSPAIVRAHG